MCTEDRVHASALARGRWQCNLVAPGDLLPEGLARNKLRTLWSARKIELADWEPPRQRRAPMDEDEGELNALMHEAELTDDELEDMQIEDELAGDGHDDTMTLDEVRAMLDLEDEAPDMNDEEAPDEDAPEEDAELDEAPDMNDEEAPDA